MKKYTERKLVQELVRYLSLNSAPIFIHTDRDSGAMRHTRSGWDLLVAKDGHVVFIECKVRGKKLTDWQKFTAYEIYSANCLYLILVFSQDKKGNIFVTNAKSKKTIELRNISWEFLTPEEIEIQLISNN